MKLTFTLLLTGLIVTFNSWAENGIGAKGEVLVKSVSSWNGSQLPKYPEGQPEISILKIQIPAGVKLPMHQHPVINAGVLTKGTLTVISKAGERLVLNAGDPIIEIVNQSHYGINEGTETAEIIVFYAGVTNTPITIKD